MSCGGLIVAVTNVGCRSSGLRLLRGQCIDTNRH
ncbi:hypothetical protein MSMEI_3261 [Mycolicibacterium smegmatis MC2 155]|uniref:Uncharacterized protein n=1 Tax=Mycolicibacterium smegmatis (strain ATCC 700084 / mc(2)155) TaxID=246196 RepID=I7GB19_MYCS2|nr:hypothetical protein MSMEI_3261 [Mycolicibacterium smegmatis MC2 155]